MNFCSINGNRLSFVPLCSTEYIAVVSLKYRILRLLCGYKLLNRIYCSARKLRLISRKTVWIVARKSENWSWVPVSPTPMPGRCFIHSNVSWAILKCYYLQIIYYDEVLPHFYLHCFQLFTITTFTDDFKPASVDVHKEATLQTGSNNSVTVTLPHLGNKYWFHHMLL